MNGAFLLCVAAFLALSSPQSEDPQWDAFHEAIETSDASAAKQQAQRLIDRSPSDAQAWFALVRAHAMAGETQQAEDTLRTALGKGFVDFHRLSHDPVFEPLLETDLGVWLIEHWDERLQARATLESEALAKALGPGYRIEIDEERRLRYITALDEELTGFAREEVERVDRFARALFPPSSEDRPDPWVLVVLPTPEDADRLLGRSDAAGVYDHGRKGLVVRDIGPSLRHECFHALHWRHMERLGQTHPIWIREGLATLVEDVDAEGDTLRVLPSWRTNIARRLSKVRRLRPWEDFVTLTPKRFIRTRPVSNYAQARALMHWLHDEGRLAGWYSAYVDGFDADQTGVRAIEVVTGEPIDAWSDSVHAWVMAQDEVGVPGRRNPVGLGISLRPGRGDGPVIDQTGVTSDDGVRLRTRDVIREVDGEAVRTLHELYRVLGERRAGDSVRVTLDRRGRTLRATITLVREEDTLGLR